MTAQVVFLIITVRRLSLKKKLTQKLLYYFQLWRWASSFRWKPWWWWRWRKVWQSRWPTAEETLEPGRAPQVWEKLLSAASRRCPEVSCMYDMFCNASRHVLCPARVRSYAIGCDHWSYFSSLFAARGWTVQEIQNNYSEGEGLPKSYHEVSWSKLSL